LKKITDGYTAYFLEFNFGGGGHLADLVGTILRQKTKMIEPTIVFNLMKFILQAQFLV
jgi:hypothetical protein